MRSPDHEKNEITVQFDNGRTLKTLPTRDWSCILPSPKAGGPPIHLALAAEGVLDEKI